VNPLRADRDERAITADPHVALMSFVKWFEREVSPPCDFSLSAWQ